jgi:hypothetical protein
MSFLQYSDHQSIFQSFVSYLDLNAKHTETHTNMHSPECTMQDERWLERSQLKFIHTSSKPVTIFVFQHVEFPGNFCCWRSRQSHDDDDDSSNVNFSHREKVCISKLSNGDLFSSTTRLLEEININKVTCASNGYFQSFSW